MGGRAASPCWRDGLTASDGVARPASVWLILPPRRLNRLQPAAPNTERLRRRPRLMPAGGTGHVRSPRGGGDLQPLAGRCSCAGSQR